MKKIFLKDFGLLQLAKENTVHSAKMKPLSYRHYLGKKIKFWSHFNGKCNLGMENLLTGLFMFNSNSGGITFGNTNFFNSSNKLVFTREIIKVLINQGTTIIKNTVVSTSPVLSEGLIKRDMFVGNPPLLERGFDNEKNT